MTDTPVSGKDYHAAHTALLFVDPYNDFLSEEGKLWPMVAEVAHSVGCLENLRITLAAARRARIAVFIVPHHRAESDDFVGWDHPTPYQRAGSKVQAFAKGTWGGEFREEFRPQPGDTIVHEHWTASGFANTDLDFQLKQKRISHVILMGLIANTCIEGTARAAVDLGYHVTLVRDATAAFDHDAMHAAHEINAPNFAHAIVTTAELVSKL